MFSVKIWSKAFKNEENIPSKYTCEGINVSPPLSWDGIPEGAKSLALIMDDPDSTANPWVHWLVCDIPVHLEGNPEDEIPKNSKQVKNTFGKLDYGGPCPGSGTHRYFFKLYALDVEKLEHVTDNNFYKLVDKHKIEQATLMGRYRRKY